VAVPEGVDQDPFAVGGVATAQIVGVVPSTVDGRLNLLRPS
jgi:hypothetical protein